MIARLAFLWCLVSALTAGAATFTVTTTEDSADGVCDAHCSLREAVIAANAADGADTIELPAGVFVLSIEGADEDGALTGDLDVTDDLTVVGRGAGRTMIIGTGTDRLFDAWWASLTIDDVTLTGGGGVSDGGAVRGVGPSSIHLQFVRLAGNQAVVRAGAVSASSDGTLQLDDCVLEGNTAGSYGGALSVSGTVEVLRTWIDGNWVRYGGGGVVLTQGSTLELTDSFLGGNSASYGGAVHNDRGTITATNVTFSRNRTIDARGGAISISGGTVTLSHCTLAGNSAASGGAALATYEDEAVSIDNTIISGPGYGRDCSEGMVSNGHNLDVNGSCGLSAAGDLAGMAAGLGALRTNGGPTPTHALLAGSPAIDAGSGSLATDQRGVSRPVGAAPDIGAYEADGTEPPMGTPLTIPVVAHVGGVGGTPWRSDLAVTNPASSDLTLTFEYRQAGAAPVTVGRTLAGGATLLLEDVVASFFGQGDGGGSLRVVPPEEGPVPVLLSRTYSEAGAERLGQGMPAALPFPALDTGSAYFIPGLREDEAFRSNIGITAGASDVTVQVELYRADEGRVGEVFAQTVPANTQAQWRLPTMFPGEARSGAPMTARVRLSGEGIPYGSLVDQTSTDAVTLIGQPERSMWWVPVVAHNPGSAGTYWRSDLFLHNPNEVEARVSLEYLPEETDNLAGGVVAKVTVPAGATRVVEDVAGVLFGVTNGKGALRIVAAPSVVAASRTYTNRSDGGSYGLGVDALPPWAPSASRKVITGIREDSVYRTNIGLAAAAYAETIELILHAEDGTVLDTGSIHVQPYSLVQRSLRQLFDIGDWSAFTTGWVEVAPSRQAVIAYVSVVDGSSQDPIYAVAPVVP